VRYQRWKPSSEQTPGQRKRQHYGLIKQNIYFADFLRESRIETAEQRGDIEHDNIPFADNFEQLIAKRWANVEIITVPESSTSDRSVP
jgi:hypothetical protein